MPILLLVTVALVPASGWTQSAPNLHALVMERLNLTRCQIEDVTLPAPEALVQAHERRQALKVPVSLGGEKLILDLHPHSVRSEKFKLLVEKPGGLVMEEPAPPPNTWRGSVAGKVGSAVTASLTDGAMKASIRLPDGSSWTVQPVKPIASAARSPSHVSYENSDLLDVPGTCAVIGANMAGPGVANAGSPVAIQPAAAPVPGEVRFAQIAFDTDVEFFQLNGSSVAATMADIESILNAVDAIYIRDVGIAYQLTTILVRTAGPGPYSSTDSDTLLLQFGTEWTVNQIFTPRDIAHLMTGKDLDGKVVGRAQLGVVCVTPNGLSYGLSQSRFSSSFPRRVAVTAHELGHNWGACHCNEATCVSPTPADCDIMFTFISPNPGLTFGATSSAQIVNHRNTWGLCTQSSDVFVNANAIPPGLGTPLFPFKTVTNGKNSVPTRGRVLIQGPNNYRESLEISRSMSLIAIGGPITIGQ